MRHAIAIVAGSALMMLSSSSPVAAQTTSAPQEPKWTLRVCADPDNMPFSNRDGEGFENKIAMLIAAELGGNVAYTWWPHRRGFVRSTLRSKECDAIIGIPRGFDPVLETKPYYRSTYYFVTRADRNLGLTSLDDPRLRTLKIGVNVIGEDYTNPPPAHALGQRGITARGYDTFYNEEHRPEAIVNAVASGEIDVAIIWGPLAGYFAKRQKVPLSLVAIPDSVDRMGFPFAYDIAVGVRRSDKPLRAQFDEVLERRKTDIQKILRDYSVPMIERQAVGSRQ